MHDPGILQGARLAALFDELIARNTIISICVMGTGYERLTCIVAVEQSLDGNFLLIDQPDGFSQISQRPDLLNLRFTFNGPDRLEYIFDSRIGGYSGRNLRVSFPEYVNRLQRRKDFRVSTLPGTRMVFLANKLKGVIDTINISLGGALGVVRKHNQKDLNGPLLTLNQQLHKVGIIFPADKEIDQQILTIDKAEVRRIEHDIDKKRFRYAFEFTQVAREQRYKLTQAIYHIQRQFLKNR